jgi:hypothetical protein
VSQVLTDTLIWNNDVKLLYASCEMSELQLVMRQAARLSGVPFMLIERRQLGLCIDFFQRLSVTGDWPDKRSALNHCLEQ